MHSLDLNQFFFGNLRLDYMMSVLPYYIYYNCWGLSDNSYHLPNFIHFWDYESYPTPRNILKALTYDGVIWWLLFESYTSKDSLLSFYDINLDLNLIFLDFLVWLFFYFLFQFYLYHVVLAPSYLTNCDYLWRCFREEQKLEFNSLNWLKDKETLEVLENYTKQLSGLDLNLNQDDEYIKNTKTYKKLALEFFKFNKLQIKYSNLMSNLSLSSRRRSKKRKERATLIRTRKIVNLILKLKSIQKERDVVFNYELISKLTTPYTFDYIFLLLILIILIIIKFL